jgi:glycosyltransferase involved in cell wall biosynthesis
MKIAVVTPYCRERPEYLRRCIDMVKAQSVPCDHIMVADGNPHPAIRRNERLRHLVLPLAHGDNGNVARTMGGLAAATWGYDAVAWLDADNGFLPDHLESLLALQRETGLPLVASWRSFHRLDGSLLRVLSEEEERLDIVDTSCWLVTRPAFDLLDAWLMPLPLGPICDRVFFQTVKFRRYEFASTRRRSVCFTTTYRYHYELAKEPPPPDAKEGVRVAAHAWLQDPANRAAVTASLGFCPKA